MIRDQTRKSRKALLGPLLQQERSGTSSRFPCSLTEGGEAGGRVMGWAGGMAQSSPLVVMSAAACRSSSGVFVFLAFLYHIVHNLPPDCACVDLFLVLFSFFLFSCSRRRLSRCRLCSKRSQAQVPACLDDIRSVSCFNQVVSTGVHTSLVLLPSKLADEGKTQAVNTQWKLLENMS